MKKMILSNFDKMSPLDRDQWDLFQKLISNLSNLQKIWVSGYLYGLVISTDSKDDDACNIFSAINSTKETSSLISSSTLSFSDSVITILSASQTGNARELAKKLYQFLIDAHFNVNLISVADYNVKKISQEKLLFLIISTYGDGDPPEEALTLHKYLFSKRAPNMKNIYFSVFGLGDRSYENFSKAAKDFDFRLEELGACRLFPRIDADLNYEEEAKNWRKSIIKLLKNNFMIFSVKNKNTNFKQAAVFSNVNVTDDQTITIANVYTKENPFTASLLVRQKITSRKAVKDVYHLEIDLSGSGLYYSPGDALGVWYENDPDLVDELLKYCNLTGDENVSINNKLLSLRIALEKCYELTHNTVWVARRYAALIANQELLSLFTDSDKLKNFVLSNSIIDMIRRWPPKSVIARQLLSILRLLTPRFYSIASSQKEVGDEVHITVGIVRYKSDGYIRTGGASGYLINRLSEGDTLRVFIASNESFRLPMNSNISIIMIAAGTGIAPFRAFIQERSIIDNALGKNWLFFGNLSFLDDFLYQREWQKYVKSGVLTYIDTAWSRDQESKIYVQDKILQNGLEVWKWIENGAYIYVCGDASRMAKGVENTLIQLIIKYGKMSFEESDVFLEKMRTNHRYQRDIY